MTDSDKIISRLLLLRSQGYIKSEQLENELGVSGSVVRDQVRELRRKGVPIISDDRGYGFAKDKEELKPTLNHLMKRALSQIATLKALERNYYNPSSQDNLFERSTLEDILDEVRKMMKD